MKSLAESPTLVTKGSSHWYSISSTSRTRTTTHWLHDPRRHAGEPISRPACVKTGDELPHGLCRRARKHPWSAVHIRVRTTERHQASGHIRNVVVRVDRVWVDEHPRPLPASAGCQNGLQNASACRRVRSNPTRARSWRAPHPTMGLEQTSAGARANLPFAAAWVGWRVLVERPTAGPTSM